MEFFGPYGWLFAVLGGAVLLGLGMAIGMYRSSRLTRGEAMRGEAATHATYEDAERERKAEKTD